MWVGGSFVSIKADPHDVDVTYLVRASAYDRLGVKERTDLTDAVEPGWCAEQGFRVDPYLIRLPDDMQFSRMLPCLLDDETNESFRDIGLYDEVWQRVKTDDVNGRPAKQRRGYVEVLL